MKNTKKHNMVSEEDHADWVSAAFSDDALVAELLSRLNQSPSSSIPSPSFQYKHQNSHIFLPPHGWGLHRPRSKPKPKESSSSATNTYRCSPTTPLSWSGGSSEDCGDCYSNSNSSRPSSSDLSRSTHKGDAYADDLPANIYTNRRSKKKKSFTELKEEESLLLKERVTLKRELASLHATLNQQRVRSESLKRIKIDLNSQTQTCIFTTSYCHPEAEFPSMLDQIEASAGHIYSALLPHQGFGSMGSCKVIDKDLQSSNNTNKGFFALPDLNMMPSEEDGIS